MFLSSVYERRQNKWISMLKILKNVKSIHCDIVIYMADDLSCIDALLS